MLILYLFSCLFSLASVPISNVAVGDTEEAAVPSYLGDKPDQILLTISGAPSGEENEGEK